MRKSRILSLCLLATTFVCAEQEVEYVAEVEAEEAGWPPPGWRKRAFECTHCHTWHLEEPVTCKFCGHDEFFMMFY